MSSLGGNGWSRHELLVLTQLDETKKELRALRDEVKLDMASLRDEIGGIRVEVAMLKVKSGLWGAAAGAVPALVVVTLYALGGTG